MTDTSKSYADALFSLALETNSLRETQIALSTVRDGLYYTPDAINLLASPAIDKDDRFAVLDKTFGDAIPEHVMGLLHVMVGHGHIRELDDCHKAFNALCDAASRLSTAYVASAVTLTDAEKAALTEKLSRKLNRTIRLECTVDPSLLGGMVVRVDGKVFDGSLKHRLHEIKEVMK